MPVSAIGSYSAPAAAAPEPKESAAPAAEPVHTAAPAKDTVKLSQAAQVHLLKQQGQSPSQIQSSLGISAAVLNGYLGIVAPRAAAAAPVQIPLAGKA